MCGRFTLTKPPDTITQHFSVPPRSAAVPRYNIAPSQAVPVVRALANTGERELVDLSWGFLPSWTRDPKTAMRSINARAETIATKPAFRESFKARRCLIPADGFYEWQVAGKRKQPWYIHRADDDLFAFGGLWDRWRDPATGECVESCTIVTTTPNEMLASIHDRMPLILAPDDYEAWLSAGVPSPVELLRPFPASALRMHKVSTMVGSPANDNPECRAPLVNEAPPRQLLLEE